MNLFIFIVIVILVLALTFIDDNPENKFKK